jgi:type II secretory pathway component PulM
MAGVTTVMDPLRERFSQLVASMSSRDRSLFIGLIVFFALTVLGGGWWVGRRALADLDGRIESREATLAQLKGLASDQEEAAKQVKSIEEELRKSSGQDLPSFIEKAAEQVGIATNLQGVREKQVTTEGTLEEKSYNVEVAKISLEQLTSFLYAVETGGYPLRVRSMKTKSLVAQGVKVLSVTLDISAFRLLDAGTAPPAEEATP